MCMLGDFIKEFLWNHVILAPVRNFFNRGKVKEEVQQGVEVVVNAAEQGLEKLDQATSGAVTSLADELSKAGVDLNQFKNQIIDGLEKDEHAVAEDVHKVENEVTNVAKKAVGTVENIGHGLKDEFQHVETQTEVKVEQAKEATKEIFTKTAEGAENALKKTEDSVVETVSSVTSSLASFVAPSETKKEVTAATKEEKPSLLSQGLNELSLGIQNAEKNASAIENKIADELSSLGIWKTSSTTNTVTENPVPKAEDSSHGWTTSLLTKEKELASSITDAKETVANKMEEVSSDLSSGITELKDNLQTKKEEVSSGISTTVEKGEQLASAGVEKATQGLSSLQESLTSKKDDILTGIQQVKDAATAGVEKVGEDVDNLKKEVTAKKKEVTSGFSSDLHFLQDTVVASKNVVVEALHLDRSKDDEEKDTSVSSAPEFQSTQKPLGTSPKSGEEKPAESTDEHSSHENSTNTVEVSLEDTTGEEEMDQQDKKETSPVKEVSDFLKQEISDASKNIESKKEELKQGVSEVASAAASGAQAAKDTIFDSITDISSTLTNTLHNIETGLGTKVKEAGDFIAGTEEEIDDKMDEKELKTEAVTSLLDKSFI